ncbi:MAG: hypothetical protein JXR77_02885 [Lentisphaeria bacterium]|nr:hypothetical protein [Lentisphaeria bacterium]
MKFPCPSCGQRLSVDDAMAGAQGECPTCGAVFTVPPVAVVPPRAPAPMSQGREPSGLPPSTIQARLVEREEVAPEKDPPAGP